ncbi:MAG: tRNA lysidine(34) synthetase TilS [Nitrospirales bacterium]
MSLERCIEDCIVANQMLAARDHVLVSVSGGPDSVALLSLLHGLRKKWCLTLHVVHFDHGLRGDESDADAGFVKSLCQGISVPCIVKRLYMNDRPHGFSLQEYARNVRYQELACLREEIGATKVAIGHTADDQVETMIMWMVRGAGTKGLCGIPPVRQPHIIRPLLGTSRSELLAYLQDQGVTYRSDSSNDKPVYLRNRIRHEVVPVLKQYNPNILKAVARQATIVREEDAYLEQLAREALVHVQQSDTEHDLILHRTRLMNLPAAMQRRVLRIVIQKVSGKDRTPKFDIIETVMKHIMTAQSGSLMEVHGVSIVREYGEIYVRLLGASRASRLTVQPMSVHDQVVWPLTGQVMNVSPECGAGQNMVCEGNAQQARFDADTCSSAFVIRNWKAGDHFHPLGMGGKRKKLQDFFVDIKLGHSRRHTVPLLVAPEGIVWVGGYRLDHRFRVTESTKSVLVANLSQEPHPE